MAARNPVFLRGFSFKILELNKVKESRGLPHLIDIQCQILSQEFSDSQGRLRFFPNYFKNVLFISVINVDASTLKGQSELDEMREEQKKNLEKYVNLANQFGFGSDYRIAEGTDVIEEMEKLSTSIAKEFPSSIFFAGKLVFEREKWYQSVLFLLEERSGFLSAPFRCKTP